MNLFFQLPRKKIQKINSICLRSYFHRSKINPCLTKYIVQIFMIKILLEIHFLTNNYFNSPHHHGQVTPAVYYCVPKFTVISCNIQQYTAAVVSFDVLSRQVCRDQWPLKSVNKDRIHLVFAARCSLLAVRCCYYYYSSVYYTLNVTNYMRNLS